MNVWPFDSYKNHEKRINQHCCHERSVAFANDLISVLAAANVSSSDMLTETLRLQHDLNKTGQKHGFSHHCLRSECAAAGGELKMD